MFYRFNNTTHYNKMVQLSHFCVENQISSGDESLHVSNSCLWLMEANMFDEPNIFITVKIPELKWGDEKNRQ